MGANWIMGALVFVVLMYLSSLFLLSIIYPLLSSSPSLSPLSIPLPPHLHLLAMPSFSFVIPADEQIKGKEKGCEGLTNFPPPIIFDNGVFEKHTSSSSSSAKALPTEDPQKARAEWMRLKGGN
jgi:hypothetical protein